jgi:hypothetical protein
MEFVRQLSEGLGTHLPVEVLPENVLVRTPETMVWWTPPCGKTMFFADHDPEAARLNGQHVPSAAAGLASDGERSYGSVRSRRVGGMAATSKLMVAPFWNVDGETGLEPARGVCDPLTSTVSRPSRIGIAILWERVHAPNRSTAPDEAPRRPFRTLVRIVRLRGDIPESGLGASRGDTS